jgi:hypothetical protein
MLYWKRQLGESHTNMKLVSILWLAGALPLLGQVQGVRDAKEIGLPAGSIAADFSLVDQFGQRRTLESVMGPQGLVVVFFRSADW